jgi:hypothetical protein
VFTGSQILEHTVLDEGASGIRRDREDTRRRPGVEMAG